MGFQTSARPASYVGEHAQPPLARVQVTGYLQVQVRLPFAFRRSLGAVNLSRLLLQMARESTSRNTVFLSYPGRLLSAYHLRVSGALGFAFPLVTTPQLEFQHFQFLLRNRVFRLRG